jgi:hypothetical protein
MKTGDAVRYRLAPNLGSFIVVERNYSKTYGPYGDPGEVTLSIAGFHQVSPGELKHAITQVYESEMELADDHALEGNRRTVI